MVARPNAKADACQGGSQVHSNHSWINQAPECLGHLLTDCLCLQHVAPNALEGEIVKSPEAVALAKEVWGAQGYDVEAEEGVLVTAGVDEI